jgi:hypothetical protein
MTVESIAFWEIVLDGIALFLCGFTVAYLIKLRRDARNTQEEAGSRKGERFNDILLELIEQSEQTFQRVTDVLQKEREFLQELGGGTPVMAEQLDEDHDVSRSDASRQRGKRDHSRKKGKCHRGREKEVHDRYGEATQLARLGMNEKQIWGKVKLPESEIGLIVDLNTMRKESASQAM